MNETAAAHAGANEWRAGWTVVLAATLGAGIAAFHTQAVGALMTTLTEAYGWTRTQVTSGPAIISVVGLFMSPAIGLLIGRVGARRIGLAGIVLFGLALALVGQAGPEMWSWYAAFAVLAVVSPMVSGIVWTTAVNSRFDRFRGTALGITMSGIALIGGTVPIVSVTLAERFGVRGAFAGLGLLAVLVALPVAWLFFFDASDLRRVRAQSSGTTLGAKVQLPGLAFKQALTTPRFWRLVLAMMIAAAVSGFFSLHLQPILRDAGVSATDAALTAGAIAPSVIASRLLCGALMDRIFAPFVLAAVLLLPLLACILLASFDASLQLGIVVAVLIGFALGAEGDAMAYLAARYFGMRDYAAVYGVLVAMFTLGYGMGPLGGAAVFDATGGYTPIMIIAGGALLVSCALLVTLGRFPTFAPISQANGDGGS
jgi:MFS family permease